MFGNGLPPEMGKELTSQAAVLLMVSMINAAAHQEQAAESCHLSLRMANKLLKVAALA